MTTTTETTKGAETATLSDQYAAATLRAYCPTCRAAPGDTCHTQSGKVCASSHQARYYAADRNGFTPVRKNACRCECGLPTVCGEVA
jgi:hypothetical protein